MRYASAVDGNQAEIVDFFREVGFSVECTHSIGGGYPDCTLGLKNFNFTVEIKDGSKPPSQRKLTRPQVNWHETWNGQRVIINSLEEAIHWSNFIKGEIDKARKAGVCFNWVPPAIAEGGEFGPTARSNKPLLALEEV